jgi:UDP-glucose 4-epimerase
MSDPILVTGASGFIGSHLLPELARRHEVVAVTRGPEPAAAPGIRGLRADLTTLDVATLPARVEAVVHLAQSRRYRDFPGASGDIFGVNVESTFRLLEYARGAGARSFVLASTGGIYDYSYDRLVETAPVNPINFYLSSKYSAELLTANYRDFFRTVVLRFFFVYGPGQGPMLIPTLLRKVVAGETIAIERRPGLRINPIHVSDAVRVFEPALALDRSDVFNVAGDESLALEELVALIADVAGREPVVENAGGGLSGDLIGDNTRMKETLGVAPRVTLREGLETLLAATAARPGP